MFGTILKGTRKAVTGGHAPSAHPPSPPPQRPRPVHRPRERPAARPAPLPRVPWPRRSGSAGGRGERLQSLPPWRRRPGAGARPPPRAGRRPPLPGVHLPPTGNAVERAPPAGHRVVPPRRDPLPRPARPPVRGGRPRRGGRPHLPAPRRGDPRSVGPPPDPGRLPRPGGARARRGRSPGDVRREVARDGRLAFCRPAGERPRVDLPGAARSGPVGVGAHPSGAHVPKADIGARRRAMGRTVPTMTQMVQSEEETWAP